MARLSKKLKQEWDLFISPKTGRRTYNDLCRKCRNDCKQSFRAIVMCCPMYCSKRSIKSAPNSNGTNLRLIYERNGKGIALKEIEILD